MDRPLVVGFDGCLPGWIGSVWRGPGHQPDVILLKSLERAETELPAATAVIAIDIPLGLLDAAVPGGRACDREARGLLGPGRASSVFSPPARQALAAKTHAEASQLNRSSGPSAGGLSIQAFAIFPKLRDADVALAHSAWLRDRVIEVHPEICFRKINGSPLQTSKKRTAGKDERRRLLTERGVTGLSAFEERARRLGASTDDALDACAAAWSGWRRFIGEAECVPADATGPDHWMRIWF